MKHVLEEMWLALAAYQPQADKDGHGKSWAKMCREKTSSAAYDAACYAAEAAATSAACYAADAAATSVDAYAATSVDAYAAEFAQRAINRINLLITPPQRTEQEIVALREALASSLDGVYVCDRVWSAWSVGTMSEDDFYPASESDEVLDSLVSAVTSQPRH